MTDTQPEPKQTAEEKLAERINKTINTYKETEKLYTVYCGSNIVEPNKHDKQKIAKLKKKLDKMKKGVNTLYANLTVIGDLKIEQEIARQETLFVAEKQALNLSHEAKEHECKQHYERLYQKDKEELEKSIEIQKLEISKHLRIFKDQSALIHSDSFQQKHLESISFALLTVIKKDYRVIADLKVFESYLTEKNTNHLKPQVEQELMQAGATWSLGAWNYSKETKIPQKLLDKAKLYRIKLQQKLI